MSSSRIAVIGLLLLFPSVGSAFIPPSEFIIHQAVKKRFGTVSLKIRSQVATIEGQQPTSVRFRLMTQVDVQTKKIRLRAYDDLGKELYAATHELPVDASAARSESALKSSGFFYFLVDPRSDVVSNVLASLDIPLRTERQLASFETEAEKRAAEVTSLGRLDNLVAWLIGPEKRSAFQPQVWIEKDTFLPVRLIADCPEGRFDVRYRSYRFSKEVPYPRTVDVYAADAGGKLLMQETVQDVWVNPEGNEMARGFAGEGFTEVGNLAPTAIREFILASMKVLR